MKTLRGTVKLTKSWSIYPQDTGLEPVVNPPYWASETAISLNLTIPFVERLIGTTRREFLDHVLFWNARDLERKLADFQAYDNEVRSHASLKGHTPSIFAGGHMVASAELNNVRWVSHCRDLVQLPVAA